MESLKWKMRGEDLYSSVLVAMERHKPPWNNHRWIVKSDEKNCQIAQKNPRSGETGQP